jgi:hypothetical protein
MASRDAGKSAINNICRAQVERWFGLITHRMIRRGTFCSVPELERAIYQCGGFLVVWLTWSPDGLRNQVRWRRD